MTFKMIKTFLVIVIGILPNLALALPTWQSTYTGSSYCSWGKFSDLYPKVEIGELCAVEGEELEIFDSGSSGYECNPYTTLFVVCCGENIKCPIDRDQNEYRD